MSDKDKRRGWLRGLKVGDRVIIERKHNWRNLYNFDTIATVKRVTPTGRITATVKTCVSDGLIKSTDFKFDQWGVEISDVWNRHYLREYTEEKLKEINTQKKRLRLTRSIGRLAERSFVESLPIETLEAIHQLLPKEQK